MAKKSAVERNRKRELLVKRYATKREQLKAIARNKDLPVEERFAAQLKLASLPRNSAVSRVRNRCQISGRPRAFYRKFRMSRIAMRDLASQGLVPGMVKSSW